MKRILPTAMIAVAVALLFSGITYWWQIKNLNQVQNSNLVSQQQLQQEIAGFRNELEQTKKLNAKLIKQTEEYTVRQDPETKEILYNNTKYGFSLRLPERWKNRIFSSIDAKTDKQVAEIVISPLIISVQPIEKADKVIYAKGMILGTNAKYSFVGSEGAMSQEDESMVAAMMKELPIDKRFSATFQY